MDEIAGLAEKLAALCDVVDRLQRTLVMGFTLMDMEYARGFDDGKRLRMPRPTIRHRREHDSHLRPVR